MAVKDFEYHLSATLEDEQRCTTRATLDNRRRACCCEIEAA
jgi:hypothetical protein